MRKTNKIIIAIILISVMLLGIGYAAIQNITLNVTGTAQADPNQANFTVKFSETTSVSDASKVIAAVTNDTNATINVEGLTAAGETVTATYTVQNTSDDLSADLTVETTNSNKEYFTISSELEKTSLIAGEATTLTVTVELIKTPITDTETATIGIQLTAAPVQPGEEGSTNTGSGAGGSTGGTEDEDSPADENVTTLGTYLPTGFREVSAATATEGLTIADELGNEYVWIEVPQDATVYSAETLALDLDSLSGEELTNAYTAIENDLHTYTTTYRNETTFTDTWYSEEAAGLTETAYYELKNKMLKSTFENGGFYIGKYETGTATARNAKTDELTTAVIQQNAYPYNYVTNAQAQSLASGMSSGEYTSSLMFGVQWDLVLRYLEEKAVENGIERETAQALINEDSTEFGNYSNNLWNITNTSAKYATSANSWAWTDGAYGEKAESLAVLLSTGASDTFNIFGVNDLAGNVFEWTLEYTSDTSYPCANRGGYFFYTGSSFPASCRYYYGTTYSNRSLGFRVALY